MILKSHNYNWNTTPFPYADDYVPFPADDYVYFPAPDAEGAAFDAFGRRSNDLGDGPEFEAERLRAALNGTPGGGDYKDAMFQLGLTPSEDLSMSGSRRGRFSNTSMREFRGGRLSEK